VTFKTLLEYRVAWQKNKCEGGTAFLCVHKIIITQIANALRENPSLKSYLFDSGYSHSSKTVITAILCTYFQEMYIIPQ